VEKKPNVKKIVLIVVIVAFVAGQAVLAALLLSRIRLSAAGTGKDVEQTSSFTGNDAEQTSTFTGNDAEQPSSVTGKGAEQPSTFRGKGAEQPAVTSCKDYDGNEYRTVKIGKQVWMAENLRTTHYADGTSIAHGSGTSTTTGYWYYPDGNSSYKSKYGLLYNWKAVMRNSSSSSSKPSGVQGICPTGWHVPSDAEWTQLTDYVSSQSRYCCDGEEDHIAKALASTTGWESSSDDCAVGNHPSSNNATGFSALPAGYCYGSSVSNVGNNAVFWSATSSSGNYAWSRYFNYNYEGVYRDSNGKYNGFSVRCLRD